MSKERGGGRGEGGITAGGWCPSELEWLIGPSNALEGHSDKGLTGG